MVWNGLVSETSLARMDMGQSQIVRIVTTEQAGSDNVDRI
jgi:hypothetical protein